MGGERGRIEIGIWVGRWGGWTVEVGGGKGAAGAMGGSGYVSCCVHGPRAILAQVGRCGGERGGRWGGGSETEGALVGVWLLETMDALKRFMRGFLSSVDQIRYLCTVCGIHGWYDYPWMIGVPRRTVPPISGNQFLPVICIVHGQCVLSTDDMSRSRRRDINHRLFHSTSSAPFHLLRHRYPPRRRSSSQ